MDDDRSDNTGPLSDRLFRMVATGALSLSVVSGGYTISSTDDRIRASEVHTLLKIRDTELRHLHEQYRELKGQVDRIDRQGPAVGNSDLTRRIQSLEDRDR